MSQEEKTSIAAAALCQGKQNSRYQEVTGMNSAITGQNHGSKDLKLKEDVE